MRNVKPDRKNNRRRLKGIGTSEGTLGRMEFFFHFGGRECSVKLKVFRSVTPLIVSNKGLERMGRNYRMYHKKIERLEDRYLEPVEIRI